MKRAEAIDVGWDIVLVGPELQPDKSVHVRPGRRVYTHSCLLHEAELDACVRVPTMVFAFNTGIGACVPHHMRPWLPTMASLLELRRPLLLTCFGPHEARMEDAVLRAFRADFTKHAPTGFGHVIEADKPLSVCNALFSWVCGGSCASSELKQRVLPYVDAQLRGAELLIFLKEAPSHVTILSDPEGCAHAGWAEMYDGRFVPCLKQALEEDDDSCRGVQTIVRCSMATLASACRSSRRLATAVLADLGAAEALPRFIAWAAGGGWTGHKWIREEVLQRAREVERLLEGAPRLEELQAESAEPLFASFSLCSRARLRSAPSSSASVRTDLASGRTLRILGRSGLWLRAASGGEEAWLLAYEGGRGVGQLLDWDVRGPDAQ